MQAKDESVSETKPGETRGKIPVTSDKRQETRGKWQGQGTPVTSDKRQGARGKCQESGATGKKKTAKKQKTNLFWDLIIDTSNHHTNNHNVITC
jgi:hypothetical protein